MIPTEPVCAVMSPYFDMFLTQLFTILGTAMGVALSATVTVPMATFYWPQVQRLMNSNKFQ
jgi:hypothetical protein